MLSHAVTVEVTDELLREVKRIVKAEFLTGYQANHLEHSPQFHDPKFPTWGANKIDKTPFSAGQGPRLPEMSVFFDNTVFNDAISVGHILAIGDCLGDIYVTGKTRPRPSFYDYCLRPRENEIFGDYRLTVEILCGDPLKAGVLVFPNGIVESLLTVTRVANPEKNQKEETRVVHVTIMGLVDNCSLYLADGGPEEKLETDFSQSYEERKKTCWELLCKSSLLEQAGKTMFVHCTAGLGRTGHMIGTFEFVKNYAWIFETSNPMQIADRILDLVDDLRISRPALILNQMQMLDAIDNMVILYQYGLEKGYIQTEHVSQALSPDTRAIQTMLLPSIPEEKSIPTTPTFPEEKSVPTPTFPKKPKKKLPKETTQKQQTVSPPDNTTAVYGSGNPNLIFSGPPLVNTASQLAVEMPVAKSKKRFHCSVM
ncbi:MAG TPA: hypothetical protein VLJ15_09205 [Gammaproteobacteria bacterium]|nr:hypothetical protein [Gammaproteobacteria bacterium]